ncbi:12888_t:CDS:2 [Acaulospora morrowiae]|uniref:12888_t:CDS:1 n=1 Tax=Acaulospora morrowiae TaxID=94023 RepID=A0A9N9BN24_9GLOM|nr:12888_t:CDS:2 [Acaulospora morrowiae]
MNEHSIIQVCNSVVTRLNETFIQEPYIKDDISDCNKSSIYLLRDCLRDTSRGEGSLVKASSLVDYAREKLHTFPYKDVPLSWRRFHTDATLVKGVCEIFLAINLFEEKGSWEQVIGTLDMTLIMTGAPGSGRREMIFELIEETRKILKKLDHNSTIVSSQKIKTASKRVVDDDLFQNPIDNKDYTKKVKSSPTEVITDTHSIPIINNPLSKVSQPSLTAFTSHVTLKDPTPFIITSSISHWPAFSTRPWNTDYLLDKIGRERLVPVEIGAKYTDESWTQKIVNFGEFVERWIKNSDNENIAYLAQHDLFTQVPSLQDDVVVPDYCFVDTNSFVINLNRGNDNNDHSRNIRYTPPQNIITNAWFGPKGTISPMHTDPYHNLLAQVVGRKYVRLYSPNETYKVYPFEKDGFLNNTSQVSAACSRSAFFFCCMTRIFEANQTFIVVLNRMSKVEVENPNLDQFPLFATAQYKECILEPGELLYIPPGWWHYVRSLSVSFSDNLSIVQIA